MMNSSLNIQSLYTVGMKFEEDNCRTMRLYIVCDFFFHWIKLKDKNSLILIKLRNKIVNRTYWFTVVFASRFVSCCMLEDRYTVC